MTPAVAPTAAPTATPAPATATDLPTATPSATETVAATSTDVPGASTPYAANNLSSTTTISDVVQGISEASNSISVTLNNNTPTTVARAPTSTPVSDLPTATPTPTNTQTPMPTPTSTRTPISTLTRTPIAIQTVIATATNSNIQVTATQQSSNLDVTLISPTDGQRGEGRQRFAWQPNLQLQAGQAFEVVFWEKGQVPLVNSFGIIGATTEHEVTVDLNGLYNAGKLTSGEYQWSVLLVENSPYKRLQLLNNVGYQFFFEPNNDKKDNGGTEGERDR